MKKRRMMTIAVSCMMMLAVCVDAPAKVKKTVERGMTKEDVTAILGKPKLTSFDSSGDEWRYESSNILTGETKYTTVVFDLSGKVVGFDNKTVSVDGNSVSDAIGSRPAPQTFGMGMRRGYARCLDDASFSTLYNKVKNASFCSAKLDLIEVASLGGWYSCSQTARLIGIFTFADDRLKALKFMAPHIVDPQNAADIYRVFTFESEKTKAGEILRSCQR